MTLSMAIDVMVVSIDDSLDHSLRSVAEKYGWMALQCPSLRQAMRQVMACNPRVVIVQVSKITDAALQLVRMLQSGWRKIALIVSATKHDESLEREARMAGCTAYLPEGETAALVDQYVGQVLEPRHAAAGAEAHVTARRTN